MFILFKKMLVSGKRVSLFSTLSNRNVKQFVKNSHTIEIFRSHSFRRHVSSAEQPKMNNGRLKNASVLCSNTQ